MPVETVPALEQVIYISSATRLMSDDDLSLLLNQARKNNRYLNLTGMLLYCEGSFIQVLEGHKDTLENLFAKILRDPRHRNCQLLLRNPIETRLFEDWYMGFKSVSQQQFEDLPGYVDFFGDCPIPDRGAAALELLSNFRATHA
jgi:hypothetical protein